jgi:hypothetical protein
VDYYYLTSYWRNQSPDYQSHYEAGEYNLLRKERKELMLQEPRKKKTQKRRRHTGSRDSTSQETENQAYIALWKKYNEKKLPQREKRKRKKKRPEAKLTRQKKDLKQHEQG